MTNALNAKKGEAVSLDRKGVEYASLEREAASARQVFDSLLQQTKEAALSSELQRSSVRVVDPAEPPGAPIRPRQSQGLATAGILGLLGAVGAAFGRKYLRKRIVSPHDIERHLGLPVLALFPRAVTTRPAQAPGGVAATFGRGVPPPARQRHARRRRPGTGNVIVVTVPRRRGQVVVASHWRMALAAVDSASP